MVKLGFSSRVWAPLLCTRPCYTIIYDPVIQMEEKQSILLSNTTDLRWFFIFARAIRQTNAGSPCEAMMQISFIPYILFIFQVNCIAFCCVVASKWILLFMTGLRNDQSASTAA